MVMMLSSHNDVKKSYAMPHLQAHFTPVVAAIDLSFNFSG